MKKTLLQFGLRNFQLLVLSLAILVGGIFAVEWYQEHWVTAGDGAMFQGQVVEGMTRSELRPELQDFAREWNRGVLTLEVVKPDRGVSIEEISIADLGLEVNVEATLNQLISSSQTTSVLAAGEDLAVNPVVVVPQKAVDTVREVVSLHERLAQDADITIHDLSGKWTLRNHREGLVFPKSEQQKLPDQLLALAGKVNPVVEVKLSTVESQISLEDLQELYVELQNLLARNVSWRFGGEERVFSLADYPELVELDYESKAVLVNETLLKEFFSMWFETFDQEAGAVDLSQPIEQEKGHRLASYEGEFLVGRQFLADEMVERVLEVLKSDEGNREIDIAYKEVSPKVTLEGYGELELISQGRSSFAQGNGENRVFNIRKGLDLYDGMVVMPGEEFSFNQVLGYVFYEDGWKPALAIFGGGGVTEVPGGGLCQVSTTMYRAAIWAGMPITQRKPHSLDVSYYHQYGYGIDSTIYPPADIDLKFRNDTPGPIVIHTRVDDVLEEAVVEFYGVDDGREIELEQTINRTVNLPRTVEYTDEITTGYQEVMRRGRSGRYIEWDWIIRREDGTVEERTIETLYPAERRVVRVGTGN